jgi:DnaJ-class molecular chaperone
MTSTTTAPMNVERALHILQLEPAKSPSKDAIERAFRKISMKYHPDRHVDEQTRANAVPKFLLAERAKSFLLDFIEHHDVIEQNKKKAASAAKGSVKMQNGYFYLSVTKKI